MSKGSLYQGGINVPFFITGPGVTRTGTDQNLANSTDLFCTIAELCGVDSDEYEDSKSLKPLLTESVVHREFQYGEMEDGTNDEWTISNGTYKLIETSAGGQELYDLSSDPYERRNLLDNTLSNEAQTGMDELKTHLATIRK